MDRGSQREESETETSETEPEMRIKNFTPGLAVCDVEGRSFFVIGPHPSGSHVVKIGLVSSSFSGYRSVAAECDELFPCLDLREILQMRKHYKQYTKFLKHKKMNKSLDGRVDDFEIGDLVKFNGHNYLIFSVDFGTEKYRLYTAGLFKHGKVSKNLVKISHFEIKLVKSKIQVAAANAWMKATERHWQKDEN